MTLYLRFSKLQWHCTQYLVNDNNFTVCIWEYTVNRNKSMIVLCCGFFYSRRPILVCVCLSNRSIHFYVEFKCSALYSDQVTVHASFSSVRMTVKNSFECVKTSENIFMVPAKWIKFPSHYVLFVSTTCILLHLEAVSCFFVREIGRRKHRKQAKFVLIALCWIYFQGTLASLFEANSLALRKNWILIWRKHPWFSIKNRL